MEFCYGDSSDSESEYHGEKTKKKIVKFDWVPPNISKALVSTLV